MSLAKSVADGYTPPVWASPKLAIYDLGEAMDALYGAGAWSLTNDAKPAATSALQALRARYGRGTLRLAGAAAFRFNSGLGAADVAGHFIEGFGDMASQIQINFSSGAFFPASGDSGYTGGGIRNVGFSLLPGLGSTSTEIVRAVGSATYQGDQLIFENIYASAQAGSYYYRGANFDGTARTSPQGIRVLNIRNWQQFLCHNAAFVFWNVVQGAINNIGSYSGSGTGNDIIIGGGGSTLTNTTQLGIDNLVCSGELNLTNAQDVRIQGKATSVAVGSTFDNYDVAVISGSVSGSPGASGRWLIY